MKKKIVVIIPTYNEQESIEKTLLSLQEIFSKLNSYNMNILVFDSASIDNTQQIVKNLQKTYQNIFLMTEPNKTGIGSAYIQAMNYVMKKLNADIIFQYDADGSHQPKYIPLMLDLLEKSADVVVGSRYISGGSIPSNWVLYRKLLSTLGNLMIRFMLTHKYTDFTSGYRAIKVKTLKRINLNQLLSKNYAFLMNLTWLLHKAGANIKELPIEFIDRKKGSSKLAIFNILETLKVVIFLRVSRSLQNK